MEFKHFVITLFNLKLWKKDKQNHSTQTAEWLATRFRLFETYCLPSVKAQTCPDFIWLVLFDEDTPACYRGRIEAYAADVPQFRACFYSADEAADFLHADDERNCRFIRRTVASLLEPGDRYVLTTNVDNDDAIHCGMVEALQRHFRANPREVLYSMNWGLQYFPKWDGVLRMRYPHNHFLSLAERTGQDFRTVMFYGHANARKRLPTVDLFERPYWMEVVHACNVNNELRVTTRIRYKAYWKSFSLADYGLSVHIPMRTNLTNAVCRFPVYFARVAVVRLAKKLRKYLAG